MPTFQSYRLPTDREWSRAVGIEHEAGNTPEERSGKIRGVYPWGDGFPPPNDIGNYAGSESRVDTPETGASSQVFTMRTLGQRLSQLSRRTRAA